MVSTPSSQMQKLSAIDTWANTYDQNLHAQAVVKKGFKLQFFMIAIWIIQ